MEFLKNMHGSLGKSQGQWDSDRKEGTRGLGCHVLAGSKAVVCEARNDMRYTSDACCKVPLVIDSGS